MLDYAWAEGFARDWVASWNSHDVERVLSHYADDFEMESPLIVCRLRIPTGRLKGKEAIRSYWAGGLHSTPNLEFKLLDFAVGVNTIAIRYYSLTLDRTVTEVIEFNERRLGVRAAALHVMPGGKD
ncbi:MAG TPA: nuclear transport factor 2 family protein [Steroidobacteraceae bacterium]|nr:nuclear transport factor 2 family protein [Steroidobacteraceae bacterium]